jgi:hypothetical protein
MVFKAHNNASSKLLAVFLLAHKEGTSYKVFRVENGRRLWLNGLPISGCASRLGTIPCGLDLRISLWIGLPYHHHHYH